MEKQQIVGMMHAALDQVVSQASPLGRLNTVRITVRENPVAGVHVHADGAVTLHFHSCVSEKDQSNQKNRYDAQVVEKY